MGQVDGMLGVPNAQSRLRVLSGCDFRDFCPAVRSNHPKGWPPDLANETQDAQLNLDFRYTAIFKV